MDSIRRILSRNLQNFNNKVNPHIWLYRWTSHTLLFGLMNVLSMQQTPAYSRHTLHQDATMDRAGRPLHRHHSLGERYLYNTITHWPQVLHPMKWGNSLWQHLKCFISLQFLLLLAKKTPISKLFLKENRDLISFQIPFWLVQYEAQSVVRSLKHVLCALPLWQGGVGEFSGSRRERAGLSRSHTGQWQTVHGKQINKQTKITQHMQLWLYISSLDCRDIHAFWWVVFLHVCMCYGEV